MKASRGIDFSSCMRSLCAHIVATHADFGHIDLNFVAVAISQTRVRSNWGIFASLTPLRFPSGGRIGEKRGRTYQIQRVLDGQGREMLYILTFYLPRFQDLSPREKLITIFHELWHISPNFNGDIRRHAGRCYAHTGSQAQYDAHMARLIDDWLPRHPLSAESTAVLQANFQQLHATHGGVFGLRIHRPKLIPVSAKATAGKQLPEAS